MILIPMAGLSSRFAIEGYKQRKYALPLWGNTVFYFAVKSFERYFTCERFLFIALESDGARRFIHGECEKLGITNYEIVELSAPSKGQADTVYQALHGRGDLEHESALIFNIDTFRPGYEFPSDFLSEGIDGYLETFIGEGKNWSNVVPFDQQSQRVFYATEKQESSSFCCTGLYYWSNARHFVEIFEEELASLRPDVSEIFVAPLYNRCISRGKDIRYTIVDRSDVVFCGVPSEYEELRMQCAP